LFAADPSAIMSSRGNYPRNEPGPQSPAFYATSSNKGARIIAVVFIVARQCSACAHTKAFALSMTRYDFCIARDRNHLSRFRPVSVWLLLIIVASRLAVQ